MSNQKDNLDNKLSEAKQTAHDLLGKNGFNSSIVEVAKPRSVKDIVLWIVAISALITAAFVNYKLPGVWQPASDIWIRIGIIAVLVVIAIICMVLTSQGSAFKVLLKDASIELRRVTWPTKSETIQYTWQSLLVIGIVALIVWILDNFFNWLVGFFIG